MGLFKMPKQRASLISGKPKGKDLFSPNFLAMGLASGLEKGGYATAKTVLATKKVVSKATLPRFKAITATMALKQEKDELKKRGKLGKAPMI